MKARSVLLSVLSVVVLGGSLLMLSFSQPGCIPIEPENEVCEAGFTKNADGKCVPGCQSASDCKDGQECQEVLCKKDPCYGVCQDCGPDHTFDKESGKCVPGCKDKGDCSEGKFCQEVVCVKAPCYGICTSCPDGETYEAKSGKCVPGCKSDGDCADGDVCEQVVCVTTPCYGQCKPKPVACKTVKDGDFGMCDMLMGVAFDGVKCSYISGCGCSANPELCKSIYKDFESCNAGCGIKNAWYTTCGGPVCHPSSTPPDGVKECPTDMTEGEFCKEAGKTCWVKGSCEGSVWKCTDSDPKLLGCPKSQRQVKKSINYLGTKQLNGYYNQLLSTKLATYEYKNTKVIGKRNLGFIIEDTPQTSMMVNSKRTRVDLYGYTTMAVAGIKVQAKQIDLLKKQIKLMNQKLNQLQKNCANR